MRCRRNRGSGFLRFCPIPLLWIIQELRSLAFWVCQLLLSISCSAVHCVTVISLTSWQVPLEEPGVMSFVRYLQIEHWILALVALWAARLFYNKYSTPLRKVPGPFWASCSRIPRFFAVLIGRPNEWELNLHRRYGSLVRVGPDLLSVGDPAEINQIYGASTKFKKVVSSGHLYSWS